MQLDILNAQTGHTTITYDTKDAEQVSQAKEQINELLRLGFAIFVEHEGKTDRITSFDAERGVYKIGAREVPASAPATAIAKTSGGCVRTY